MTNHLKLVVVAALFLAAPGCVSHIAVLKDPMPILNRWVKLDATSPGAGINVLLHTGMTISGTFQGSNVDRLTVTTEEANEMNIAKADVLKITSLGADSLQNGALWGLGFGTLGALGGAQQGVGTAVAGLLQPLILYMALDWRHQEHEVLYIAP